MDSLSRGPASAPLQDIGRSGWLRARGGEARPAESVADALTAIHQPARSLIIGSLYLAGAVLAENGTPPA